MFLLSDSLSFPPVPSPADILLRSQAVFSDVQDEFSDVKKILSRFEEWRGSYSDSYHSAYISLCLPKLLNPIIRHQLLAWNPLKVHVETNPEPSSYEHTFNYTTSDIVWLIQFVRVSGS